MKIAIFIGGLSGGGAERVVCNLSNFLARRHKVTILTMASDEPIELLNSDVIRVVLDEERRIDNFLMRNYKRYRNLTKYLKKSDDDVFIVMLPETTNILLSLRNRIKAPIIVSERGNPIARYKDSWIKTVIMHRLYPHANAFIFQTEDVKDYYLSEGISVESSVIPNAINEVFLVSDYSEEKEKRIVAVGRLAPVKNFPLLIHAFEKISKKHSDYTLEIFGEGVMRGELQGIIRKLSLSGRVSMPGYVRNISERLRNASLFVLSSNYEGMPNALMEAMALGLPCISTDCPCGGPNFLIKDGENGVLVPVGDCHKMAVAMDKMLSNPEFAYSLGNKARGICDRLAPSKIYSEWEKTIEKIVYENRGCEIRK